MMKKLFFVLLTAIFVFFCSCEDKPSFGNTSSSSSAPVRKPVQTVTPQPQPQPTPEPQPQPEPEPEPEPEFINELSGLGISAENVNQRPIAVMINNDKHSLPQSGISKADIIFECEAEGGATRMMALFKSFKDAGIIGTVRSARDYFIDFAQIFDAVYVHAGGSPAAYEHIKNRKIDNLDGVNMYLPDCFWRDAERLETSALEHTLVTSGDKINEKIDSFGYRRTLREDYEPSLHFTSEPYAPDGKNAEYIKIPRISPSEFTYDAESGVYRHVQYGIVQSDKETNTDLTFENVIILYVPQHRLNDDKNRISVNFTGSGKGYFISGGKYIPIAWQRDNRDGGVIIYDEMGQAVELNPGKTFISIASTYYYSATEIR